jgi:2-polyprenyl-3-methyl-5-hydroxy-6-metoxy-1,4-benzoquinol methylase
MKQDRFPIIKEYVKDKSVLDIGCVSNHKKRHWNFGKLHKFLVKYSKKVVGLDINKEGVKQLSAEGYNIIYGNAENFKLNEKFDVIVAGELIEHLNNQGLFLENCYNHLKENGYLLLTTPNVFGIRRIISAIFRCLTLSEFKVNPEHTLWHDKNTLIQICKRFKFKNIKICYYLSDYGSLKANLERIFFPLKILRPQLILIAQK